MNKYNLQWNANWNYYEPKTDTEYHMSVDENGDIHIIFNGSEDPIIKKKLNCQNLKDWILNILCWNTPYKDMPKYWRIGWRHYGLFLKWKAIRETVSNFIETKYLESEINTNSQIFITGYSQGAALAVFCNEDIRFQWDPDAFFIQTIVAGCPKLFSCIGFKNVKPRIDNIIYLINENDIVTKLPPWNRNAGKYVYRNKEKRKWYKLSVQDHLIYNYSMPEWQELIENAVK